MNVTQPSTGVLQPVVVMQLRTALGYEQLTSLTTATALTPPAGATLAVISVEGAAVRYRDDGTAPTATVGMPLAISQQFTYSGDFSKLEFIGQAAGAILNVSFYK